MSYFCEDIDVNNLSVDCTTDLIRSNKPLDDILHCVMMISNPCYYNRRYKLANEFINRMKKYKNVILYIVEVVYTNKEIKLKPEHEARGIQPFVVTQANNPRHLQLSTDYPVWHKENAINLGIRKLLPAEWKAMAWIDADLIFESAHWVEDTLKLLNQPRAVYLQLFSHCVDMDSNQETMNIFQSFGYQYRLGRKYVSYGNSFWHPGFAWACNRQAYDMMGGLYQDGVLGSGDTIMALSLIGISHRINNSKIHPECRSSIKEYQSRFFNGSDPKDYYLGYTPGTIRHFFHGTKQNRRYHDRWIILANNKFNPYEHLKLDPEGLIIPSDKCPPKLLQDIYQYFQDRLEDD